MLFFYILQTEFLIRHALKFSLITAFAIFPLFMQSF